jgi:hypothetical protein
MPDSLDVGTTAFRPYPARRERLPFCITGTTATLANAQSAPCAERASNGVVTGASMAGNEQTFVRITMEVQNTSGVSDCLDTRRNDLPIAEEDIEPLATSGYETND